MSAHETETSTHPRAIDPPSNTIEPSGLIRSSFLTEALDALRRRPPPPPVWVPKLFIFTGGSIIAAVGLAVAGWAWEKNSAAYFGEKKLGTVLSAAFLIASAAACLIIHRKPPARPFGSFWIVMAVFMGFLALDELLRIHERLDIAIHWLLRRDQNDPITDHIDDLVIAGYGLLAASLWWRTRRNLLRLPWMLLTMAAAAAATAAMLVADVFDFPQALEDGLKLIAGALIFCAFYAGAAEMDQQIP